MSDQTKFVNAYIDIAVNQVHEYLNLIMQLKAQIKVANDLVSEKDAIIGQLSQELESNKVQNEEFTKLRAEAKRWEEAHDAVMGKASHLDRALAQIMEMKKETVSRDETITSLRSKVSTFEEQLHIREESIRNQAESIRNHEEKVKLLETQLEALNAELSKKQQINKKKNTDKSVSVVIEEPVVQTASTVREPDDDF